MKKVTKTPVVISWSSGKDSALTLLRLLENDAFEVVGLFTTYFEDYVPFQATPIQVVQEQAGLLNLPLIKLKLPKIFPENELYKSSVVQSLTHCGISFNAVAFGDMFCNGISQYRQSYIEPAGWQCVFPLMGQTPKSLADEIIKSGIESFICTVDTEQLDGSFVGRQYDKRLLEELPSGIDPCGENGEFHTLVTNARCFKSSLKVKFETIDRTTRFHFQRYCLI